MFKNFFNRSEKEAPKPYVRLIDGDELKANPEVYQLSVQTAAYANKIIDIDDRDSMIETTEAKKMGKGFIKGRKWKDYSNIDIKKWFENSIVRDKTEISERTLVVRSKYGNAPIGFFNIVSLLDGRLYTGELTSSERNMLKSYWAKYANTHYPDLRICTYDYWSNLPTNEKLGTCVIENNSQLFKEFIEVVNRIMEDA